MAVAKSVATIRAITGGGVLGEIRIMQRSDESTSRITGRVTGLTPGNHGLRVCAFGDESSGMASLGPIYNPLSKRHGEYRYRRTAFSF